MSCESLLDYSPALIFVGPIKMTKRVPLNGNLGPILLPLQALSSAMAIQYDLFLLIYYVINGVRLFAGAM